MKITNRGSQSSLQQLNLLRGKNENTNSQQRRGVGVTRNEQNQQLQTAQPKTSTEQLCQHAAYHLDDPSSKQLNVLSNSTNYPFNQRQTVEDGVKSCNLPDYTENEREKNAQTDQFGTQNFNANSSSDQISKSNDNLQNQSKNTNIDSPRGNLYIVDSTYQPSDDTSQQVALQKQQVPDSLNVEKQLVRQANKNELQAASLNHHKTPALAETTIPKNLNNLAINSQSPKPQMPGCDDISDIDHKSHLEAEMNSNNRSLHMQPLTQLVANGSNRVVYDNMSHRSAQDQIIQSLNGLKSNYFRENISSVNQSSSTNLKHDFKSVETQNTMANAKDQIAMQLDDSDNTNQNLFPQYLENKQRQLNLSTSHHHQPLVLSGQALSRCVFESGLPLQGTQSSPNRNDIEYNLVGSGQRAINIDAHGQGTLGIENQTAQNEAVQISNDGLNFHSQKQRSSNNPEQNAPLPGVNQQQEVTAQVFPLGSNINQQAQNIQQLTGSFYGQHFSKQSLQHVQFKSYGQKYHSDCIQQQPFAPDNQMTFNNTQGSNNQEISDLSNNCLKVVEADPQQQQVLDQNVASQPESHPGYLLQHNYYKPSTRIQSFSQEGQIGSSQSSVKYSAFPENLSTLLVSQQRRGGLLNRVENPQMNNNLGSSSPQKENDGPKNSEKDQCTVQTLHQILQNVNEISKQLENKARRQSSLQLDEDGLSRWKTAEWNQPSADYQSNPQQESAQNKNIILNLKENIDDLSLKMAAVFKILALFNQYTSEQEQQNLAVKKQLKQIVKEESLFEKYTKHDLLIKQVQQIQTDLSKLTTRVTKIGFDAESQCQNIKFKFDEHVKTYDAKQSHIDEQIQYIKNGVNRHQRINLANQIQNRSKISQQIHDFQAENQQEAEKKDEANTVSNDRMAARNLSYKKSVGIIEIIPSCQSSQKTKSKITSKGKSQFFEEKQSPVQITDTKQKKEALKQTKKNNRNVYDLSMLGQRFKQKKKLSQEIQIVDDLKSGNSNESSNEKSIQAIEPFTARQTAVSKTEKQEYRVLPSNFKKKQSKYYKHIQLKSSSSESQFDQLRHNQIEVSGDKQSLETNTNKQTSLPTQIDSSRIFDKTDKLQQHQLLDNQLIDLVKSSDQQNSREFIKSPQFNQQASITSRGERPQTVLVKDQVKMNIDYNNIDDISKNGINYLNNSINADIQFSQKSFHDNQPINKSQQVKITSNPESLLENSFDFKKNNPYLQPQNKLDLVNKQCKSEFVLQRKDGEEGAGQLVCIYPENMILRGESLSYFDSKPIDQRLRDSHTHIDSIQSSVNHSMMQEREANKGSHPLKQIKSQDDRQTKQLKESGNEPEKAYIDLQNKYRVAKDQLVQIQQNYFQKQSIECLRKPRFGSPSSSDSNQSDGNDFKCNSQGNRSNSKGFQHHLKYSNYQLHCALKKKAGQRPAAAAAAATTPYHAAPYQDTSEPQLHFDYLSDDIQDALKYTQKKLQLKNHYQNQRMNSQGEIPKRKDQNLENQTDLIYFDAKHDLQNQNYGIDGKEILVSDILIAPQRSISHDCDIDHSKPCNQLIDPSHCYQNQKRQGVSADRYNIQSRCLSPLGGNLERRNTRQSIQEKLQQKQMHYLHHHNLLNHQLSSNKKQKVKKAKSIGRLIKSTNGDHFNFSSGAKIKQNRKTKSKSSSLRNFKFAQLRRNDSCHESHNRGKTKKLSQKSFPQRNQGLLQTQQKFQKQIKPSKIRLNSKKSSNYYKNIRTKSLNHQNHGQLQKGQANIARPKQIQRSRSKSKHLSEVDKLNLRKLRSNLKPRNKQPLKQNDSMTPRNICLYFNANQKHLQQVYKNQNIIENPRDQSLQKYRANSSENQANSRNISIEKVNSDLITHSNCRNENSVNDQFEKRDVYHCYDHAGGSNGSEKSVGIQVYEKNLNSQNHMNHLRSPTDIKNSNATAQKQYLASQHKEKQLQNDIDCLKKRLISQKAEKLKKEIRSLKQQLYSDQKKNSLLNH